MFAIRLDRVIEDLKACHSVPRELKDPIVTAFEAAVKSRPVTGATASVAFFVAYRRQHPAFDALVRIRNRELGEMRGMGDPVYSRIGP